MGDHFEFFKMEKREVIIDMYWLDSASWYKIQVKSKPETRHILRSAAMLNGLTQGLNQRSFF